MINIQYCLPFTGLGFHAGLLLGEAPWIKSYDYSRNYNSENFDAF